MGTLNYTTEIESSKTIGELQSLLANQGADAVVIQYVDRQPVGIRFLLSTPLGPKSFALPVNVDAVHRLLVKQSREGKLKSLSRARAESREQAARVAWRVVKDWVAAQLAIIEAEMATIDQVMLPYLVTNELGEGSTLYDSYKQRALESKHK